MKKRISKIWQWLIRPHYIIVQGPSIKIKDGFTQEEKIEILRDRLTRGFEDYDKTTKSLNINPAMRATQEMILIQQQNLVDYYFELLQLNIKHGQAIEELNKKYGKVSQ